MELTATAKEPILFLMHTIYTLATKDTQWELYVPASPVSCYCKKTAIAANVNRKADITTTTKKKYKITNLELQYNLEKQENVGNAILCL